MGRGAWVVFWLAVMAGPACAAESLPCDTRSVAWERREFQCPLMPSSDERHLQFKANFSGGHDDTEASMTLTLDGVPIACTQGSKTSLMGEFGDVSLECRLVLAGQPSAKQMLGATVKYSHAEFVGIALSAPYTTLHSKY